MGSIVSIAQLAVTGDALNRYNQDGIGFPSTEVKNVLIFALITAVWGVLLAVIIPIFASAYSNRGAIDSATPNILFFTFILDCVSAILLTKGSAHGGACIEKGLKTCQLYTAALALEWVMCGLAAAGMAMASYLNTRSGLLQYPDMGYA